MAKIFVDGNEIDAKNGELLIDVLLDNGINIPHFCYHKALGKDGNCRMCMVEIEGQKRPQIACDTPVTDGQIIRTHGEKIDRVKKNILELELINHPIDCPICDQAGECKLQDYYMDVGLYESRLDTPKQKAKKHIELGSHVMLDQERCVLCTRCVRFTKNITKTNELGVLKRADHSVITTFPGKKLDNPYAMNVVDLCPVGALTSEDFRFHKRVWFLTSDELVCDGCSRGCSIFSDHHKEKYGDDVIYRYRPRFSDEVNGHFICDFGRLSYKKENENREFFCEFKGEQKEYLQTVKEARELLEVTEKRKLFLISPNLSIEEMFALKQTANYLNAEVTVSIKDYYEKDFGDDLLKKSDLALNKNGAKVLGLDISNDESIIDEFDYIVLVGLKNIHAWQELIESKGKFCGVIDAFKNEGKKLFFIPMRAHSEKVGTFLTCDEVLQKSVGTVEKNSLANSLVKTCSILGELNFNDEETIWKRDELKVFDEYKKVKHECRCH